jgi:pimeloyl-ACP methyl ester carboxylesterase
MLQRQTIQFCQASDGVRLAYACVGNGPPLVKAANWLNHLELDWDAPIWAPLFQELARDHMFVRYDERGNGMSQCKVADISFDAFVRDLETVVDAAGIERFPLLGISQGCAVAIEYAVRHPERVSHLILWGGYAAGWRINATPDVIEEREAIITLVRQGWGRTDAAYRQVVTATFMPSATAEELDWFNIIQRQTVGALNAARYLEVFADIDVRGILKDVQTPTLVMHARGDQRIPLSVGGKLAAEIPGAEFVTLDSDNHLLLGREPASLAFVAHVRQFLSTPVLLR